MFSIGRNIFFYSAVWLEQQSADWHVAPLGHIILIRRSLYIAMILIRPYAQTVTLLPSVE